MNYNLRVVCIDNKYPEIPLNTPLNAKLVFFKKQTKTVDDDLIVKTNIEDLNPLDWEENMLNIEGFGVTLYNCRFFIEISQWRNNQLDILEINE